MKQFHEFSIHYSLVQALLMSDTKKDEISGFRSSEYEIKRKTYLHQIV
jgi:hypothetical protein